MTFDRGFSRHAQRPRRTAAVLAVLFVFGQASLAGPYVTPTSGIRWQDVGGIRWQDVGGIRWQDVGGIRWNDVGGIRWQDVGGTLSSDASGLRWQDVGGIRWQDVGGLQIDGALESGVAGVDLDLLQALSFLPDTSSINVIVTYRAMPGIADLAQLQALGIVGGTLYRRLPMVVVNATPAQVRAIAALPNVRSIYADRTLSWFDAGTDALIGLSEATADPELFAAAGAPSGSGVMIAILDTGVDATHPDLPYGAKVAGNVRLGVTVGTAPGFVHPVPVEGVVNSDTTLGHGTFVASVAAGTGSASLGAYRGVAPGASILALSAGDLAIVQALEGFDYILDNGGRYAVRVVNCSWGTPGFFDPDDPINVATRILHDAGVVVVFAAGNHGPSPDTLNRFAVAPWVIGVGSVRRDGRLSSFSSRGQFEEMLYRPALTAPGEGIIAARAGGLAGVTGGVGVADPSGGTTVPPGHAARYTVASGTSFAAPQVAGVAALLLEADPGLTPRDIKRILQETATPVLTRDRAEVGAGRLDAWAALARVHDAARPFGRHVPGWFDQRPYRIEHQPAVEFDATVTSAGPLVLPRILPGAPAAWSLGLAWGPFPTASDLDLTVLDPGGQERSRSGSINGLGLFGATEGTLLLGPLPGALTIQVAHKVSAGATDQPVRLREETAVAVITAYTDVAGLAEEERDLITRVVSRRLMIGHGDRFELSATLRRSELARALALVASRPQRLPALASFADTPPAHPDYPYVESIAGTRATFRLIEPRGDGGFGPDAPIFRLDFVVAVVRALGREAEAQARAGEHLGLMDDWRIPVAQRGHVAIALEEGLIDTIPLGDGQRLMPKNHLSRRLAAGFLLRLLEILPS